MNEAAEDLEWLQELLDESYRGAAPHLASIHTESTRLSALDLVQKLDGMQILVVATVTTDGRPLTGPVDSFLHHGRFHFGTAPNAVRARHLARSPAISATHVRGEELVVSVHGDARPLDLAGHDRDFGEVARSWYGNDAVWHDAVGWAIEPVKMFAADMSVHTATS